MIIDLHELLQEDNGNRSYHLQLEADVFETSTASYKIKDYDLQLSFHNEGKKHISSRCEGFVVLEIPCDRCLEPVDYKIDIDYFKDTLTIIHISALFVKYFLFIYYFYCLSCYCKFFICRNNKYFNLRIFCRNHYLFTSAIISFVIDFNSHIS